MKRIILIIGLLVITQLFTASLVFTTEDQPNMPQQKLIMENMSLNPLAFTENHGQWDERVKFKANAGGANMWFTEEGVVYQFTRRISVGQEPCAPDVFLKRADRQEPDSFEQLVLKASFVGANLNPAISGEDLMEYKCNYFIGNDPNQWHTDIPNYQSVYFKEIYPGIDLKYYGNGKQMEYDFIVSPGTDYSQIQIQYEGAKSLSVNSSGELVVETEWGNVIELKPIVYQMDGNNRQEIEGRYNIIEDNTFSFKLGDNYNPSLPLVIDPVLVYSTYLGGSHNDEGWGITVDVFGCAYVTGNTPSTDFPTVNPYQTTFQGGADDAFVTKLSSTGNSLIYSTYLGGSSGESGLGIVLDASGCAYVTGYTYSSDFPTENPYQTDQLGMDVFVTKLSNAGNSLIYSTYLGGSGNEHGLGVAVDAFGCAYVTGDTYSTNFPTVNPYQTDQLGTDVFVTKLSNAGNSLIYSTYLGGSGNDYGDRSIAVDASGCTFVTGYTSSSNFPTVNPYQATNQGNSDVFVTKLSSAGNSLIYSTYLGGSGSEFGLGIALDASGCTYVTGYTYSSNFPTVNPYQTCQGNSDVFVTKLSSAGNSLIYSTYLGGSSSDYGVGIALDASGCTYVTGYTYSSNFPTVNPYQTCQGNSDVFVTKLSSAGNSLIYSTYLGGSSSDYGVGIALDASGCTYVTGYTSSSNFPTVNPYQTTYQGDRDAFVAKFSEEEPNQPPTAILGPDFNLDNWHDSISFTCNEAISFECEAIAQGTKVIDSVMWAFDDGDMISAINIDTNEYYDTLDHQFEDLSCDHFAVLTAWDSYGLSSSDTLWVHISQSGSPEILSIGAEQDGIAHDDTIGTFISGFTTPVTFYASASMGDCQPDSVAFDLGGTIVWSNYDKASSLWKAQFPDIGYLPAGDNQLLVRGYDCEGTTFDEDTVIVRLREIPTWYSGSWLSLIEHHEEYQFMDNGGASYYQLEVSIPEPPVEWGPYDFSVDPFFPDLSNHLKVYLGIQGKFYTEGYSSDFDCNGSLIAKILGKGIDSTITVSQEDMVFDGPYNDLAGITIYDYNYEVLNTTLWDHEGTLLTYWVGPVQIDIKYSVAFGLQAQISFGALLSVDTVNDTYLYLNPEIEPWFSLDVWASILFGVAEIGMNFTPTFGIAFPCTLYIYPEYGLTTDHCTYFILYYSVWASVGWGLWEGTLYEGTGFESDSPEGCHWGKDESERTEMLHAVMSQIRQRMPQVFETPDIAIDPTSANTMLVWVQDKYPEDTAQVDAEVYYAINNGDDWIVGTITNNDRWETNPVIAFLSPDSVIAVWTQNEIPESDWGSVSHINTVLSNQELYYSIWTYTDSSWSTPDKITNNSLPDGCADIGAADGKSILAWVRDLDGDAATRTDWRVYYSWFDGVIWTTPDTIYEGIGSDLEPSVAIDQSTGQAIIVWTHEPDGDFNTPEDRSIYYRYIDFTSGPDVLGDDLLHVMGPLNPSVALRPGGEPVVAYTSRSVVWDSVAAEWDTVGVGLEDRLWLSYYDIGSWQSLQVDIEGKEVIATNPEVRVDNDDYVTIVYRGFEGDSIPDVDGEIYSISIDLFTKSVWENPIQYTSDSSTTWMPAFDIGSNGNAKLTYVSYEEPDPGDPLGNINVQTGGWTYICGDANSDDVVNISDAVYIINYVFVGGDPPDPIESGDCNCDDICNVSDAVWIINYVFVGGNEPCDTDGDGEPDC